MKSTIFNLFFMLDIDGAKWRQRLVMFTLLGIWFGIGSQLLQGTGWTEKLGASFQYVLTFTFKSENPIPDLLSLLRRAFFSPTFLRIFALLLAPFLFAYRRAYNYLSDIYELKDQSIAAKFIRQAAFASKYEEIKIENGEVSKDSENSPIRYIGGPGYVKVDLCSAALFEKPNGRPHVIGPVFTPKEKLSLLKKLFVRLEKILGLKKPDGEFIEGFERLRGTKNLRDEVLDSVEVSARTREGIKVTAKDVRMVYSIWRGYPTEEELKTIYPYSKQAIPPYFYSKSMKVSELELPFLGSHTANYSPTNPMLGIIKGALGSFITKHSLSEFLSAVGEPEKTELKDRAEKYQEEQDLISRTQENSFELPQDQFTVPDFVPRHEINPLLSEFTEEFSENNRKKGVVLQWLGTGTWATPDPAIFAKNMEAWQLSKENKKNGTEKKLQKTENKEKNAEMMRLVQHVLLNTARIIHAPDSYRDTFIYETLLSYMELIKEAKNIAPAYESEYSDLNTEIFTEASQKIYKSIEDAHWIGARPPLG
ncbi:MAG: hypothetical protein HN391_00640 [Anaerolineae bacterium]|nr:hypothetical protein [Anaerolineae bacterium]